MIPIEDTPYTKIHFLDEETIQPTDSSPLKRKVLETWDQNKFLIPPPTSREGNPLKKVKLSSESPPSSPEGSPRKRIRLSSESSEQTQPTPPPLSDLEKKILQVSEDLDATIREIEAGSSDFFPTEQKIAPEYPSFFNRAKGRLRINHPDLMQKHPGIEEARSIKELEKNIPGGGLNFAIQHFDCRLIELLIKAGANPSLRNHEGSTPIQEIFSLPHYYTDKDKESLLYLLLKEKIRVEGGVLAFWKYPPAEQVSIVKHLIHKGLYPNHDNGQGRSFLEIAAVDQNNISVVISLLQHGIHIGAEEVWNHKEKGSLNPIEHLINIDERLIPLCIMVCYGLNPRYVNQQGKSLFQLAVEKNNIPLVRLLLTQKAAPKADEKWPTTSGELLDPATYIQRRKEEQDSKFLDEMAKMIADPEEWLKQELLARETKRRRT
jgi:ankyrin repeat protein